MAALRAKPTVMQDKQKEPERQSPADIAREAFRRLAARRIAPTPDAYREIYDEIAGAQGQSSAEKVLAGFAASLSRGPGEIAGLAHRLSDAVQTRDWQRCGWQLSQLAERHLMQEPVDASPVKKEPVPPIGELDAHPIALVDPIEPQIESDQAQPVDLPAAPLSGGKHTRMMREMLIRTWSLAVVSLLHGAPQLVKESEALVESIRLARTEQMLTELGAQLKQLCFKIELKSGDMAEEQELLLRLFKLLLENIGELLEDDSWLSGQLANVQDLLSGPVNYAALMDATRSLKEVIYKQSLLKHSLNEAKATLKNMMLTFVDRLDTFTASTGDYHERIDGYARQIGAAKDIVDLNKVLDQVMYQTRIAQTEALRSRDNMAAARRDMLAAENRIHELQSELRQASELVREDQLTGSLNRRGLDDVLEREMARAERRGLPLCVAMLDLDDFKRLNDTHGHSAGDQALIHLVRVVKDTLRTMDIIGRFGGEEFMIVLPDTVLEDAAQAVTRLQRELTKRIFMHNHERVLITFSAGVALRKPGEGQPALIERADAALYKAKAAGKNRVVCAE
jgi:diguanylate cyclase